MFRNLAFLLTALFVFASATPETPAQSTNELFPLTADVLAVPSVPSCPTLLSNTVTVDCGNSQIDFSVTYGSFYFYDEHRVTVFINCGEDKPWEDVGGGGSTGNGIPTWVNWAGSSVGNKWGPNSSWQTLRDCCSGEWKVEIEVDGVVCTYGPWPWSYCACL